MTSIYISKTRGEMKVSDMHWNHLINTKKKILRDWAKIAVAEKSNEPLLQDPNCNVEVSEEVVTNPTHVFPVYDAICSEIDARTEANAFQKALEAVSNENPKT